MSSNILYIHSHDTGRCIRPYGHVVDTPHLQQLAAAGVLFRKAFAAAPTCSPSRACLLTGQFPHSSGMLGLAHRGFSLADPTQHLAHTLRRNGYLTALAGVQHEAEEAATLGYEEILALEDTSAASVAATAVGFLKRAPAQPFFLSTGFFDAHRPFPQPNLQDNPDFCPVPPTLPDTPATRQDMAGFHASLRALDEGIGQVLAALEAAGLADNTLVICTTDHGPPMPGMKCNLTDHGIGVMLIMRGPGGFSGGQVCDAMVSHIDLFPTLCELLNIKRPSWLQGRSLMPLIHGEKESVNDEIFAEVTYHAAYEPQRAVRTARYKYIRRFDGRERPVLPNIDDSPAKEIWLAHGWQKHPVAPEALYDLVFDPQERCNLVADPIYTTVLAEMRGRLQRWMHDTRDPLLAGPVAPPPGARFNNPDGVSPEEATLQE